MASDNNFLVIEKLQTLLLCLPPCPASIAVNNLKLDLMAIEGTKDAVLSRNLQRGLGKV
jgi:hypothetical protein